MKKKISQKYNGIKVLSYISLLIIGFAFSLTSVGSEDNGKAEAAELLAVLDMEEMLSESVKQMIEVQLEQNPSLKPFKKIMSDFLNKYMSYENLKPMMVEAYAEVFSKDELQQLIGFYRTPTGRKTIKKMPELMSRGAQIGALQIKENMVELERLIAAEAARIGEQQMPGSSK